MAYSKDYRQMILAKLESGETYRALSLEFGISKTTILNWKKQPERKVRASRTYTNRTQNMIQYHHYGILKRLPTNDTC